MVQPGPSRALRPIRPRATLPDGPGTGSSTEEGRLKRASIACTECKRRRVRCTDGFPCHECATHGRECVYDETADKRRKIAAKHTQEELQYYRRFLEQLLQAIRQSERTRVDEIIDIIRAGASDVEILTAVSRCLDTNLPKTEPEMDGYTLSDMGLDIMDENIMRNLDLESGFYNTGG